MKKLTSIFLALIILITSISFSDASCKKPLENTILEIKYALNPENPKNTDDFSLDFKVKNISKFDIKADFSLREIGKDKSNKYFTLKDITGNDEVRKLDLKKCDSTEFSYTLTPNLSLGTFEYPITLSIKVGENEFVDRLLISVTRDNVVIKPLDSDSKYKDDDVLKDVVKLKDGVDPAAELTKDDVEKVDQSTDNKPADNEKPNETPKPSEDPKPSENPGGNNGGGDPIPYDPPVISDPGSVAEGKSQNKNKPKLIISKYTFSPKTPMAGEEFTMNLSFYNTNADKAVRNIKIFLTSSDSPQSATPGESSSLGSSVFTPVDSSNTFYIPYIAPGGIVNKEIKLSSARTIAAKNYEVKANFEYEDKDGNEFTAEELIGIPIIQESKLDTGEVNIPGPGMVGDPVEINLDFYNTGKQTLYNLMVKAEGDFRVEPTQYYVGNFQSGSSDSFSFSATPEEAGPKKGKIVFTYEDSTGEEKKVEKEFELIVDEGGMTDPNMGPDGEIIDPNMNVNPDEAMGFKKFIPYITAGVLLLAIAIFLILKKRKNKKSAKELEIDEN